MYQNKRHVWLNKSRLYSSLHLHTLVFHTAGKHKVRRVTQWYTPNRVKKGNLSYEEIILIKISALSFLQREATGNLNFFYTNIFIMGKRFIRIQAGKIVLRTKTQGFRTNKVKLLSNPAFLTRMSTDFVKSSLIFCTLQKIAIKT